MRKKYQRSHKYIFFGLLFSISVASTAAYGWKWRSLDPFNRNSAIRAAAKSIDPTQLSGNILKSVGYAVGQDSTFREKAKEEGWTRDSCNKAGLGLSGIIAVFYGGAICAAATAGEPISGTTCAGFVLASGVTITDIACTQLCNDHHLKDC